MMQTIGTSSGPPLYWQKARRCGKAGFTITQLQDLCKVKHRKTIQQYIDYLRRRGYVAEVGTSADARGRSVKRFAVVRPSVSTPVFARSGSVARRTIQQSLWDTMRGLSGGFLIRELAWLCEASIDTAGLYVRRLIKADLVIVLEPGERSRRGVQGAMPGRYALRPSANTGPEPLRIVRNRVFDPNQNVYVGEPIDGSEVSA